MDKTSPRKDIFDAIIIGVLMAIATLLGVYIFSQFSMRLDEAQSLFQVSRDIPGILYYVGQDVHVPGYHLILHFWLLMFGSDITVARYLSLIFMVLTIPAVYYLGRITIGRRAAIFAALLVSLSPFLAWYGSEARMYAMLTFITVIHQIIFVKLFQTNRPILWIFYPLVAAAGLYVHYFFGFVLLTQAIFYIIYRKQFAPRSFLKFTASAIIAVAALAPWALYVMGLGSASNTQPMLSAPSSVDLFNTYSQFLFGFQSDVLNTIIVSLWPIVILLGFYALQKNRKISPEVMFFVMMATVPIIGAFIISITVRPFYLSRYLIVSLPALLLVVAYIFSVYPAKVRRTLQVLLIGITITLLVIQIRNPEAPVKEDYRSAAQYLERKASGRDVIVVAAPFTVYPTEYYYKGDAKVVTQPRWDRFNGGPIPNFDASKLESEVNQNVGNYQYAHVMLSYDQGYNEDIKRYYDGHFERVDDHQFSKELIVYTYKIRYDKPITLAPAP